MNSSIEAFFKVFEKFIVKCRMKCSMISYRQDSNAISVQHENSWKDNVLFQLLSI